MREGRYLGRPASGNWHQRPRGPALLSGYEPDLGPDVPDRPPALSLPFIIRDPARPSFGDDHAARHGAACAILCPALGSTEPTCRRARGLRAGGSRSSRGPRPARPDGSTSLRDLVLHRRRSRLEADLDVSRSCQCRQTWNRYGHLVPGGEDPARERLDAFLTPTQSIPTVAHPVAHDANNEKPPTRRGF